MALLLHEFTTNALKHGALSTQNGRVVISWRLTGVNSERELALGWREVGGPPAVEPVKTGFESRLIKMGLTGRGGATLRYGQTGFTAEFVAPLASVQQP